MDDPSGEETSLLALASHELCFSPLTKDKVTVGDLKESFEAVSALPLRLQGIRSTPFILDDNDSMLAWSEVAKVGDVSGFGCERFHRRDVVAGMPRETVAGTSWPVGSAFM
jgi:hypothetical protein